MEAKRLPQFARLAHHAHLICRCRHAVILATSRSAASLFVAGPKPRGQFLHGAGSTVARTQEASVHIRTEASVWALVRQGA